MPEVAVSNSPNGEESYFSQNISKILFFEIFFEIDFRWKNFLSNLSTVTFFLDKKLFLPFLYE